MSDEKIWYVVNRVTGRDMIAAGIAVLISSFVAFLLRSQMNSDFAAAVLLALLIVGVGIMVVNSLRTKTNVTNHAVHLESQNV